jgi:hypothetical protein
MKQLLNKTLRGMSEGISLRKIEDESKETAKIFLFF